MKSIGIFTRVAASLRELIISEHEEAAAACAGAGGNRDVAKATEEQGSILP